MERGACAFRVSRLSFEFSEALSAEAGVGLCHSWSGLSDARDLRFAPVNREPPPLDHLSMGQRRPMRFRPDFELGVREHIHVGPHPGIPAERTTVPNEADRETGRFLERLDDREAALAVGASNRIVLNNLLLRQTRMWTAQAPKDHTPSRGQIVESRWKAGGTPVGNNGRWYRESGRIPPGFKHGCREGRTSARKGSTRPPDGGRGDIIALLVSTFRCIAGQGSGDRES